MTREECLDWLYRLRGEIYVYIQPKEWLIPMNNALDMAIKALEQEQQSEWERDHEVLKAHADGQESVKPCKDAISRQAVIDAVRAGALSTATLYGRTEEGETARKEIERLINALPSISTEKTVRCKDCKWWRDSDGAYRRGVKAESRCPINTVSVANGVGYCYMFEPQESEE